MGKSGSDVIQLPYGGEFSVSQLIKHMKKEGLEYIIQGQQAVALKDHKKKKSLDYWLRTFGMNKDQKQASHKIIMALVETGRFDFSRNLKCPETGRLCRGLVPK